MSWINSRPYRKRCGRHLEKGRRGPFVGLPQPQRKVEGPSPEGSSDPSVSARCKPPRDGVVSWCFAKSTEPPGKLFRESGGLRRFFGFVVSIDPAEHLDQGFDRRRHQFQGLPCFD